MEKQAVKEATNETTVFKRTRVISYILDQVSYLRPDLQLSRALDCINSKLERQETTKLFTDANNDMKTYDQLRPATLERFTRLVEELTKEKKPDKTVDEVNTILFYAK
jgi:predicted RND superfamily exporter protein